MVSEEGVFYSFILHLLQVRRKSTRKQECRYNDALFNIRLLLLKETKRDIQHLMFFLLLSVSFNLILLMLRWFRIESYGLYWLALLEILKVLAKKIGAWFEREKKQIWFHRFQTIKTSGIKLKLSNSGTDLDKNKKISGKVASACVRPPYLGDVCGGLRRSNPLVDGVSNHLVAAYLHVAMCVDGCRPIQL